jgi:CHAD domain-containing protein
MSTETRLTLRLDDAALDRLRRHPAVQRYRLRRAQTLREHLIFFDSADHRLYRDDAMLALVRPATKSAVPVARLQQHGGDSWSNPVWQWACPGETPVAPPFHLPFPFPATLNAEFTADRQVTVIHLGADAWEIDLAIDRHDLACGGRTAVFDELSLQLKRGEPASLFRLAAELAEGLPLRVAGYRLIDRAHALRTGKALAPRKALAPSLAADCTVAQAFSTIAHSCLAQLVVNQECLTLTGDPEAIHQMRVALRRLRSAMAVFAPLIASPQTDRLRAEMRWILDYLGPARDIEVFIAEILNPARPLFPQPDAFESFAEVFRARHRTAQSVAKAAVADPRFTALLLSLALWAEGEGWLQAVREFGPADPDEPARQFARTVLERRYRRLRKALQDLGDLDEEARHQSRIEAKKFRYCLEFFSSLYPGARADRMAAKTGDLQDRLGLLNDIAVSRQTLLDQARGMREPDAIWAAGTIAGWHTARIPALLAESIKHWGQCRRLPRFWMD